MRARVYGSSRPPATRAYGGVHHSGGSPLVTLLCTAGSGAVVVRALTAGSQRPPLPLSPR